jgi:hypothetical protein
MKVHRADGDKRNKREEKREYGRETGGHIPTQESCRSSVLDSSWIER